MKKLIIAACGFMMALSTMAFAQNAAEDTHSHTEKPGHTMLGKKKMVIKDKTKIKTANGEANATVTTTKVDEGKGKTTETKTIDAKGTETK